MSEFKKWWYKWSGSDKLPENTDIRYAFEAGQQSQQAKIDEALIEMKNQLGDEDFCDMQRPDYDAMLYALRNIKDILKGNKDEN